MMGVGDCHGKRVGGVGAGDLRSREQPRDHGVDLNLFGRAGADDRFLDQASCIFADRHARPGRDHQSHSARLPKLERRLRILVDEHLLDRCGIWLVLAKQRLELVGEARQPLGKRCRRTGPQLTVGDMAEAVAVGADQAPAGGAEPRIEAEDDQPSRYSSSSGTS
jgi:hypothetical protein